ncbi:ectoine synthase [Salmonella enterica]|nr:ectoine synthase [Salmonella enterica]
MMIFNMFDSQITGSLRARCQDVPLRIGVNATVIPASSGLGSSGHYTFLKAGENQDSFCARCGEWWACLAGEIAITLPDSTTQLLQRGGVFSPQVGAQHQLKVLSDATLLRAEFDDITDTSTSLLFNYFDSFSTGHTVDWTGGLNLGVSSRFIAKSDGLGSSATFTSMIEGEDPDWAARLNYKHVEWCASFQGTLKVAWFDKQQQRERIAWVQPGMAYAPGVDEDHEISAFQSVVGLVCCFRPALDNLAVQHDLTGSVASSY